MYQSNMNNSGVAQGQRTDPSSSHYIDMTCLAILFVGLFSCLIRSDYNFAIIFFIYFVWQQRKDALALKIVLGACVGLIISDILFGLVEIRVWLQEDPGNGVWQTIKPMHYFGIACFALINILKVVLLGLSAKALAGLNKAVQAY